MEPQSTAPPAIRSSQRGPQDPGHQQPQRSTEPRKPTAGTTTHPPRRLQRKPPDRAPTNIGQRPPGNPGQQPTDPARPQTWAVHRTWAPGARAPPKPLAVAPPNTREGQAPQTATVGQRMPQCPWPSALGVKMCQQVGEAASSRERQGPPHRDQHKQARGQQVPDPGPVITTHTCTSHTSAQVPSSLNSAGVWRSGHTRGPAAPPAATDLEPAE